ncbi:sensor histidine kinase [Eubacterium barkeri]|uniref:histidine kinase n=1 Tax=Eubacterium barkeri TaxID=1528 RepID=A0A1H3JN53_EUBBA|nr:HAMP domain-containing sensor histidine kinase [Eubacterium barkeri]SDY41420.1 His Kinase A (phospho-acceptor) domain-containing protein [Eubacterium barkeri]
MKASRDFMRFYMVPIVLFAGILLTVVFTVFYTATARTQDCDVVGSNWPKTFTLAFSENIINLDGMIAITNTGKKQLDNHGLWLQVLDASGTEVMNYKKAAEIPSSYKPYEFLQLYQNGSGMNSVFMSSVEVGDASYTYLVGFPLSISKVVMYIDTARYNSGKALIIAIIALTAILVMTLTVYSYQTFYSAKCRQEQDAKAKEEWLANITHDLKTPLAPIRGYAELLSEEKLQSEQNVRRYAAIILKNSLYTEQLVDDLKLTYQLQSNLLPLKSETQNIIRFVREIVIDILNSPEYEERNITFLADREEQLLSFDAQLIRRALTNIVINALKHNKIDTEITVTIGGSSDVKIIVADNGGGMPPQELEGLFERYYRGTSTEVKAEGSGLGMAIAKQIVEAHGGKIYACSEMEVGTVVTMEFQQ